MLETLAGGVMVAVLVICCCAKAFDVIKSDKNSHPMTTANRVFALENIDKKVERRDAFKKSNRHSQNLNRTNGTTP